MSCREMSLVISKHKSPSLLALVAGLRKETFERMHYPHILQAVSAVLQGPGLLQGGANTSLDGLLLFVQVTDHFVHPGHQLAALLLLLI